MSTFDNSQMRQLSANKQRTCPFSIQRELREVGQPFYHSVSSSQPETAALCDSFSSMSTVALHNLPNSSPNKFEDTNKLPKPSPGEKEGLYNKNKYHGKELSVDGSKHEYICSTQKSDKVTNGHLSVNTRLNNDSVIRWTPGSELLYFVSSANLDKDDGKLEKMKAAMHIATQNWQSTEVNITFHETTLRKNATFVVFYDPKVPTGTYGIAFFPGEDDRFVRIGSSMFETENVDYMSHVLGHEIGHVLGLRHEFWEYLFNEGNNARYFPTNDHDHDSIMNNRNIRDLSRFVLSDKDRKNIRHFYALSAGPQYDFTLIDCDPVSLSVASHEPEHWLNRTFGRLSGWCSDGAEAALRVGIAYQQRSSGMPGLLSKQSVFQFRIQTHPGDSAVFTAKMRKRA
jgi:hypothetical protein